VTLRINDIAPDFEAETTDGRIRFHDWIGNAWCVLFSHPEDFTPVCTTEVAHVAGLKPEFDRRNTKVIGLSVDTVDDHAQWARNIRATQGAVLNFPLIGDRDLRISRLYGLLPASRSDGDSAHAVGPQAGRNIFVIDPDKRIRLAVAYPENTGRNFDEVLRVLDSLQLTAERRVGTPVNWKPGQAVLELPAGERGAARAPDEVRDISRDELRRRLRDPSLLVVDALPRESYSAAHIPGAISLPLAEVESRASELLPDPAAEIAVYCAKFT
jgi:thioredoxin-dependent peroxiredoxin